MTALVPWQDDSAARELVRMQLAPEASDGELAWFASVSRQLDLSPFAGQLVLIGRKDQAAGGRKVHRPQITVAGRRVLAVRTGDVVGIDGPEWTGPRDERGNLHWSDLWAEDGYPYAARVFVHRAGWVKPANGTVKWSEFVQTYNGEPGHMWKRMPSHMLGKTAESLALRRAFPEVIGAAEDIAGGWSGDDDVVDARAAAGADYVDVDVEAGGPVDGAGPDTAPATASPREQSAAHAWVAEHMTDSERDALCARHGVTFGEVWPDALVSEILSQPFDT